MLKYRLKEKLGTPNIQIEILPYKIVIIRQIFDNRKMDFDLRINQGAFTEFTSQELLLLEAKSLYVI